MKLMCANVSNTNNHRDCIDGVDMFGSFTLACQCDFFFSTGHCEEETGRCECRKAFQPPDCKSCAYGYYGYPNCRECECNLNGTDGYHCEAVNGECPCKINFAGHYCKQCADGYYAFPECKGKRSHSYLQSEGAYFQSSFLLFAACECNKVGSISNDCDLVSGQCKCLSNFGGERCERCKHGYFQYPECKCKLGYLQEVSS